MAPPKSLRAQIGQFVIVPVWVLKKCSDDSRAVHLYAWLMKYADADSAAWPGNDRLTAALGVSLSTLERAIAKLRRVGALTTERKRRADGSVVGRRYLLIQIDPSPTAASSENDGNSQNVTGDSLSQQTLTGDTTVLSLVRGISNDLDPAELDPEEERAAQAPRLLPDSLETFRMAWNAAAIEPIKSCLTLTSKRRRLIRACLAERPQEVWTEIFSRVNASSFCRGDKGWVVTFDWLIKSPDAAVKVLEGQYDDHVGDGELEAARAHRARVGGYCPHEPCCVDGRACVRRFALTLRSRQRGAVA